MFGLVVVLYWQRKKYDNMDASQDWGVLIRGKLGSVTSMKKKTTWLMGFNSNLSAQVQPFSRELKNAGLLGNKSPAENSNGLRPKKLPNVLVNSRNLQNVRI